MTKGKKDTGSILEPLKFDTNELYSYIDKLIINLNIPGLVIEDNLYIHGKEIRDQKNILPNVLMRPITKANNAFVKSFIEGNDNSFRYYKCIRVSDWKGELILSIFLRFSKIGSNLFVEANYNLLLPLRRYYRQFDKFRSDPSSEYFNDLLLETLGSSLIRITLFPFLIETDS